ncbi:MAG: response regulator [Deltaproteobacteria bacterium]|nr:response regulator [Deltaproteobacteria bacterium]
MPAAQTILVVDDSPFAARALVHVLESHRLVARAASTMEDAMKICEESHPCLLVTDVRMPNIDVLDLCRRFRAAESGQAVAVLLFSAHPEHEIRDIVSLSGADAFMEKRHGAAAVAARVQSICTALAKQQSTQPQARAPG